MNTHIYHYCLLQEIKTQNLLQKFTISTYNLPGLTGLPAHHKNPLLTCYLIGFLTYTIRYTIPWTPYSYCFLQSAKPWLQPTLCPQIFFTCMLKLSASSQKALYTTACVLQHTFDTLAMAQCDTEHSHTGHGAVWYRTLPYWPWHSVIQNTPIMAMAQCDTEHSHTGHSAVWYRTLPTCSHSGTAILQTLASTLVWAHWATTSKQVAISSTQSYWFSGCHSGCSSNDGFYGFSHHVNICWDILKECSASTLQVTESGSGEWWSNWEVM